MAADYSKLDAAILAAIPCDAPVSFYRISTTKSVVEHSMPLRCMRRDGDGWRFVDRRLQALRKPEGWVLAQKEG